MRGTWSVTLTFASSAGPALTANVDVPKHETADEISADEIPITYVPARNTVFLSFALAYAEVIGSTDIFIGVNALDYSGYPDCRPEYIAAFSQMANLATRAGVEGNELKIHTPLIDLTKGQTVEIGERLGVDYSLTSSCYDPDDVGRPCGRCDSCLLRLKGFAEAGLEDPLDYQVTSPRDLQDQGDLLHPPRRGRSRWSARSLLSIQFLQPLDRPGG